MPNAKSRHTLAMIRFMLFVIHFGFAKIMRIQAKDFLLPDINVSEIPQWDDNTYFSKISITPQNN